MRPIRSRMMEPVAPTAENAPVFADVVAKQASETSKVKLDYSPASLRIVDDIIEGFRREGQSAEAISATLFCFGCYVGEVFVRNANAVWKSADSAPEDFTNAPIVLELPDGMMCNPIDKAVKRLQNGEVDSLFYFYNSFT